VGSRSRCQPHLVKRDHSIFDCLRIDPEKCCPEVKKTFARPSIRDRLSFAPVSLRSRTTVWGTGEKRRHETAQRPGQSVLSGPVSRGLSRNPGILRISSQKKADFLCNQDCMAEREEFDCRHFQQLVMIPIHSVYEGFKHFLNRRYSFYSFPYLPDFHEKRYHRFQFREGLRRPARCLPPG
jgi:hypothetical protein